MSETYPPVCHGGCGGRMQPMAVNGPGSFVAMVCKVCDGPTLETMWGPGSDQAAIDAWVAEQRPSP